MNLLDAAIERLRGELVGLDSRQTAARVREAAASCGASPKTVYARLKRAGWSSGRKERSDKGRSQLSEEEAVQVAALMAKGRNKRGQANVPLREAHAIAASQGLVSVNLSDSQVNRRLRQLGLDGPRLHAQEPTIAIVTAHPNHAWFVDISVAIQWRFRDESGKVLDLYSDAGSRFYEGKIENFRAIKRTVHRYLAVDHRTGAFWVQYFYSRGENAADVVNFLHAAMAVKDSLGGYPFRGVPRWIFADRGPAFNNGLVQGLLEALGVQVHLHSAGKPWVNGAVESRHNHWQRRFEGRLAARFAPDLETLNRWAQRECVLANSEREHSRYGRPPIDAWASITREQLVECPPRKLFFQLASSSSATATLTNRLHLRAKGRAWELGEGAYPGQKVRYRLSPFLAAGIRVWDVDGNELPVTVELQKDELGQQLNGRRMVLDGTPEERGATAPHTPAAKLAAEVVSGARPVHLPQLFEDGAERIEKLTWLPTASTPWQPPASAEVASTLAEPVLSSLEARDQVVARLGRGLGLEEGDWWRARIGESGITESGLEAALAEFLEAGTASFITLAHG